MKSVRHASILLVGLVAGYFTPAVCQAELIVAYDSAATNDTLAASEVAGSVTALVLSRGPGVQDGNSATRFDATGFTTNAAPDADDYIEWGWSSSPAYDLTTLDIAYDRANTNGPHQLAIDVAVNGGSFTTFFIDTQVGGPSGNDEETHLGIDLSAFVNVTSATFRLFAFDSDGASGSQLALVNFTTSPDRAIAVFGDLAPNPVPEPSSLVLLGVGVIGCIGHLRGRRRSSSDRP